MDASVSSQVASAAYQNASVQNGVPRRFVPAGAQAGVSMGLTPARRAAIHQAATDFEAVFMTSMLESMSAGIKTDKTFGGGQAEQMYRSMMNQEYGKAIASRDTLGIAQAVEKEMLQIQEHAGK